MTVNGERYRCVVTKFLWTALHDIDDTEVMCFQQDVTTCRTVTITLLREKVFREVVSRTGLPRSGVLKVGVLGY